MKPDKECEICGTLSKWSICRSCKREQQWTDNHLPKFREKLLPPRIVRDLTKLNIQIPKEEVKAIAEDKKGFFLYGSVGTGKTLYACALLLETIKYCMAQHMGVPSTLFVPSSKLLEQIRKSFENPELSGTLDEYCAFNLLILDDFGMEKMTAWTFQTLDYIINERYEYLRPTIITSNFDLNILKERFSDRLSSRIYEMCEQKHFNGKNYRVGD